jgi:PKD repeat protein
MKKILTTVSILGSIALNMNSQAQTTQHHDHSGCGTSYHDLMKNPDAAAEMARFNAYVRTLANNSQEKDGSTKIVPVVVHVIHAGGTENVSEAAILNMMDKVNRAYSKTPANINTLPERFDTISAVVNMEFRLAKKDPFGNCTNGIRRVYSPTKAFNAYDDIGFKKLSYWDRAKYLNIWIVNNISDPNDNTGGQILGYCLFPQSAPALRDGATIAANSITTQAVVAHEIGHHYSLIHVWGDADCGDDQVDDTPIAKGVNFAWPNPCDTLIKQATCYDTISGDAATIAKNKHMRLKVGENYQNYMDYVNNYNCPNMFTNGQNDRINATLAQYSFRSNVIQQSNLEATGVADGAPACSPLPIPEFWATNPVVCTGANVNFKDGSFNATPTSWQWEFEGGTPATSTSQNPTVTYATPGVYKVTLTSGNAAGANTVTKEAMIHVLPEGTETAAWGYQETFESGWPYSQGKWVAVADPNPNHNWELFTGAGYSSSSSIRLNNIANTRTNEATLYSPSFNLTAIQGTQIRLKFKVAYAKRTEETFAFNPATNDVEPVIEDQLKIFTSSNCGQLWVSGTGLTFTGSQLVSAGLAPSPFVPNDNSDWKEISVTLPSPQADVRIKFEFTSGGAFNNFLYIDDINIVATAGPNASINDLTNETLDLSVYPNPVNETSTLHFSLPQNVDNAVVTAHDITGKMVAELYKGQLTAGEQNLNVNRSELGAAGMYFIRINLNGRVFTEKILVK